MSISVPVPKGWPEEVIKMYNPLQELGRGGFASVMLAQSRVNKDCKNAIKVIGSNKVTKQEIGYAIREIDILNELDHPNIVRILDHWKPPQDAQLCAAVVALSYASGPTLEQLLQTGGRLSLICARVVSAQLIDAIHYLHGRAVVHRDIKPDNIIVTGATLDQDEIWSEPIEQEQELKTLRQKWHVTVIDFGFARALTRKDMSKAPPKRYMLANQPPTTDIDSSNRSISSISNSVSRRFTRRMSALGNKMYAAPEIISGVQNEIDVSGYRKVDSSRHPIDVTKTLSEHVSYYGLLADAYSAGNTMKYMLTGVPPNQDVNDVLALENNPLVVIGRLVCGLCSTSKDKTRKVQYRKWSLIPKDVLKIVQGLANKDSHERMSIRSARIQPWIADILENSTIQKSGQEPNFLNFTKKGPSAATPVTEA